MFSYSTPGAYFERVDSGVPSVAPVRMDVAAFVGIARQGPLHTAVPVQSWRQFVAYFGDVTNAGYLAYAVRAFFENGGRRCWVVRISSVAAATATVDLSLGNGVPAWRIRASSPGVWGNELDIQLRVTHSGQALTVPEKSTPEYSTVTSVTGFGRGSHVRIADENGAAILRVVSMIDAAKRRIYWLNPDPTLRLAYDAMIPNHEAPSLVETIEYTLIVRRLGRVAAVCEGLTLVPEHPRYGPAILAPLAIDPANPSTWKLSSAPNPVLVEELRDLATVATLEPLHLDPPSIVPLWQGTVGADGLAGLQLEDFIGEVCQPYESNEVRARKQRGLAALEDVDEVAAVAVPDIHIQPILPHERAPLPVCTPDPCLPPPPLGPAIPPRPLLGVLPPVFDEAAVFRVQAEMVLHCERHADRIALLDSPFSTVRDPRQGIAPIRAWRKRFDSKYAALYFPWLLVVDSQPDGTRVTRAIPPSGHVAGSYGLSDAIVGVHKAPANQALTWVQDVSTVIDDTSHGVLNDEQIDAIRALPGRGIRILGARTLSSDADFRYVNVRRLLIMIEKALDLSCRWAVFEPNNAATRLKLYLSVTSFLVTLWQKGALMGETSQDAFFVRCDENTTPATARDRGEVLVEVGVAPSRPFEFVVVRLGREENQLKVSEAGRRGGLTQ